jgi:hypothetical protein
LKRALREIRIAHADRNGVVTELRDAEQARLELLAEALEGVAAEVPPGHDQLLLGMLPGQQPRYWVDSTSFVAMGRDRREYQFVKDTRLGRTVLAESGDLKVIAEEVTRYVAERIVEREQALEGDWLIAKTAGEATRGARESDVLVWGLVGFGLGMIAGMFLLLAYAWFTVG